MGGLALLPAWNNKVHSEVPRFARDTGRKIPRQVVRMQNRELLRVQRRKSHGKEVWVMLLFPCVVVKTRAQNRLRLLPAEPVEAPGNRNFEPCTFLWFTGLLNCHI